MSVVKTVSTPTEGQYVLVGRDTDCSVTGKPVEVN